MIYLIIYLDNDKNYINYLIFSTCIQLSFLQQWSQNKATFQCNWLMPCMERGKLLVKQDRMDWFGQALEEYVVRCLAFSRPRSD